jgi:hypothetical protein
LHRSPVKLDVLQSGNQSLVAPEDRTGWQCLFSSAIAALETPGWCRYYLWDLLMASIIAKQRNLGRLFRTDTIVCFLPSINGPTLPDRGNDSFLYLRYLFLPAKTSSIECSSRKRRIQNIFKYWNCVCRATR